METSRYPEEVALPLPQRVNLQKTLEIDWTRLNVGKAAESISSKVVTGITQAKIDIKKSYKANQIQGVVANSEVGSFDYASTDLGSGKMTMSKIFNKTVKLRPKTGVGINPVSDFMSPSNLNSLAGTKEKINMSFN